MAIIQPVLTSVQITEITNYVNNYRALNQAPPFVWDTTIQAFSNHWSYYLLTNNLFQHSKNQLYGENLAYYEGYGTDIMTLLKKAVDDWYNEISLYNFSNPGFSADTGHFTCLVWVASTNFSIGISIDETTSAADIVLNTSPPGNIIGEFQKNVLPVKTIIPVPAPLPAPVPIPPIPPIPISQSAQINNIINQLYNVIYSINARQPIYFMIVSINKIISDIKSLQSTIIPINTEISIVNTLNGVIKLIKSNRYNAFVINSINNIINQLKAYL
jgi:hypothetical protein